MKAKEFAAFLNAFAEMLGEAGASPQSEAWQALARIFEAKPSAQVRDVCEVLGTIQSPGGTGGPTLQSAIALAPSMRRCIGLAKKTLGEDISRLAEALRPFGYLRATAFADAAVARLSPWSTETYVQELEAALHDSARFTEIFNRVDKELKLPAAKKVALAFAKGKAKSKGDALDLIWGRHASLLGTAARARATGGRTAA
jgi:hypothetical protein